MVLVAVITTMRIQSNSDIVESFMASTIQNFTNISKMTRRRYRSIIPSTTRKFKRLGDISGVPDGVQSTQSPQDLPSSKPPRSNTTPVHTRNLEDFEKAVMEFMQEPLVSLAKPAPVRPARRRPLKCIQEKEGTEYSVPDPAAEAVAAVAVEGEAVAVEGEGLENRLCFSVNVEDNVVPKQDSLCRDQTVPYTHQTHRTDEVIQRTHDFPETSERTTSELFDHNETSTTDEKSGWRPLPKIALNLST